MKGRRGIKSGGDVSVGLFGLVKNMEKETCDKRENKQKNKGVELERKGRND